MCIYRYISMYQGVMTVMSTEFYGSAGERGKGIESGRCFQRASNMPIFSYFFFFKGT